MLCLTFFIVALPLPCHYSVQVILLACIVYCALVLYALCCAGGLCWCLVTVFDDSCIMWMCILTVFDDSCIMWMCLVTVFDDSCIMWMCLVTVFDDSCIMWMCLVTV